MSVAEKFVGGLVLITAITTALLPGRQTVPVLGAFTKLLTEPLRVAQGR